MQPPRRALWSGAGVFMRKLGPTQTEMLWRVLPVLALALFAILITVTRRGAETWSSADFGLYIMHARNLAEGFPYAATGYVPNPANNIISPGAYPFGYPLLLALPYASRGLDMFALELIGCAALIATVAGVWVLARRSLSREWALLAAIATGFVPQLLDLRDTISSDLAFTAWVMLALCVHQRATKPAMLSVLFVAIFMSEATRSAGIALTAALIGTDVLTRQSQWVHRVLITASATAAAILTNHWLGADASNTYLSYFDRMRESLGMFVVHAIEDYLIGLSQALGFSFGKIGNLVYLLVFLAAALVGWLWSLRREVSATALFLPASAALLIAFPVRLETARYLVPLLPVLVLYAVCGISLLSKGRGWGLVATALFLMAGFVGRYAESNPFRPLSLPAFNASAANELIRLGRMVPKGEAVLAANPRVLALYGNVRASIWNEGVRDEDLLSAQTRMNARYLLLQAPSLSKDEQRVAAFVSDNPRAVTPVAQTHHYRLYRFAD